MFYQFHTEIAEQLGIEKAVILHCLYTWIVKNSANNRNSQDGRYWTYNTTEAWQKLLPFMCLKSVKNHLVALETQGWILRNNYNDNPKDRTLWYAISDKGAELLSTKGYNICALYESVKMGNAKCKTCPMQSVKLAQCTLYSNITIQYNKEKYNNKLLYKKKAEENENFEETADDCMSTKDNSLPPYGETPPPTPSPKETIETRLDRETKMFFQEVYGDSRYVDEFGADLVERFYDYWSQRAYDKDKPLGHINRYNQKSWDTKKRLATFRKNRERWSGLNAQRYGDYIKRKQEDKQRSDIESLQRLTEIESRRAAGIEEIPDDIMPWERT